MYHNSPDHPVGHGELDLTWEPILFPEPKHFWLCYRRSSICQSRRKGNLQASRLASPKSFSKIGNPDLFLLLGTCLWGRFTRILKVWSMTHRVAFTLERNHFAKMKKNQAKRSKNIRKIEEKSYPSAGWRFEEGKNCRKQSHLRSPREIIKKIKEHDENKEEESTWELGFLREGVWSLAEPSPSSFGFARKQNAYNNGKEPFL